MTAAQDVANTLSVGAYEFDHPQMIRARRLWADLLARGGELSPGDEELVTYMHVDAIRDRLMADVINPYAWDQEEYDDLFRGALQPDAEMLKRMKAATIACQQLSREVEEADQPPMLMITAMCQWLTINTDVALMGAKIALKIDPEFRLAQLMVTMIQRGLQPAWLTRRQ